MDADGAGAAGGSSQASNGGAASGGLFSSPNPTGESTAGNAGGGPGEWDTPENAAVNEEASSVAGRRRSGRFLGARRRGPE